MHTYDYQPSIAGISVDTSIAYGMVKDIRTTATNSAQQQDETPPATNPTFEDQCNNYMS